MSTTDLCPTCNKVLGSCSHTLSHTASNTGTPYYGLSTSGTPDETFKINLADWEEDSFDSKKLIDEYRKLVPDPYIGDPSPWVKPQPWTTPIPNPLTPVPIPLMPTPPSFPPPIVTNPIIGAVMPTSMSLPKLIKIKDIYTDVEYGSSQELQASVLVGHEDLLFGSIKTVILPPHYNPYFLSIYKPTSEPAHGPVFKLEGTEPPRFTFASPLFLKLETFNPETEEETKHFVLVLAIDDLMQNEGTGNISVKDVRVFEIKDNLELMRHIDSDRAFRRAHKIPIRLKKKKKHA